MAKRQTCFVTGGQLVPTQLVECIRQIGFEPIQLGDLSFIGSLSQGLIDALSKADAVCAYLSKGSESATLWFELGLAKALAKPTAIVVSNDYEGIPVLLQGQRLISMRGDDWDVVAVDVQRVLTSKSISDSSRPARISKNPVSVLEGEALVEAISSGELVLPQDVEDVVARLLSKAGASMVEKAKKVAGSEIDVVAWFDETESSLGNPIAVEVKKVRDGRGLLDAQARLIRMLTKQRLGAGLVVYYPSLPELKSEATVNLPIVVTLSLEQLVKLVGDGLLLQTFVQLRNRAAHG